MFVISGVTGHVGSAVARVLLNNGKKIKVIVRDEVKGKSWLKEGAEVAVGDLGDEAFLSSTLKGSSGAFVLLPPNYSSTDILGDQKKLGASITAAIKTAKVPHIVLLSSNGADQPEGTGPVKGLYHFENSLRTTGVPLTIIRAGMFMENIGQNIGAAKTAGIYPNMMPSREIPMAMIASKDIGQLVAESLLAGPKTEIIDLHGPAYTVNQLADKLSKALKKPLNIVDIPQAGWLGAMVSGGVSKAWAEQYVEMYNGLIAGKMTPKGDRAVMGKTPIDEVIQALKL